MRELIENIDKTKVYYLASPYSHPNPFVKNFRHLLVQYIGAILAQQGIHTIDPIDSCHNKSGFYDLPTGYEFWKERDRKAVEMCDGLIVCTMKGWDRSIGLQDELKLAKELGKPVYYVNPKKDLLSEKDVEDMI